MTVFRSTAKNIQMVLEYLPHVRKTKNDMRNIREPVGEDSQ